MRKLILKMSVSVDGFVGGPNGEIEWLLKTMNEEAANWVLETLWMAGVHIMGSRTFHDMMAYWPFSNDPFAAPMNEIPKIVFSKKGTSVAPDERSRTRALEDATRFDADKGLSFDRSKSGKLGSWTKAAIASGELAEEIGRLKQQAGKDILAHGGASFAQSLVRSGLIDEYRLLVHPVALGKGLSLFSALPQPLDLKLVSASPFEDGPVAQVYRPA